MILNSWVASVLVEFFVCDCNFEYLASMFLGVDLCFFSEFNMYVFSVFFCFHLGKLCGDKRKALLFFQSCFLCSAVLC